MSIHICLILRGKKGEGKSYSVIASFCGVTLVPLSDTSSGSYSTSISGDNVTVRLPSCIAASNCWPDVAPSKTRSDIPSTAMEFGDGEVMGELDLEILGCGLFSSPESPWVLLGGSIAFWENILARWTFKKVGLIRLRLSVQVVQQSCTTQVFQDIQQWELQLPAIWSAWQIPLFFKLFELKGTPPRVKVFSSYAYKVLITPIGNWVTN